MGRRFAMEMKVLDKGFVRLVDHMGSDAAIVQAARVSYGAGTKTVREDARLIDYLMKNQHMSPFEMCEVKLHIKAPIFIARQWMRHRTAAVNEVSARYSVMKDEFYIPSEVRGQGVGNKQVGDGALKPHLSIAALDVLESSSDESYRDYEALLEAGVAREQARMVLPTSLYTEFYWKIDLRNLLNFLALRLDWHAQREIRDYAEVIHDLVSPLFPVAFHSWSNHVRYSVALSHEEVTAFLVGGDGIYNVLTKKVHEKFRDGWIDYTPMEVSGDA